jgi:hypothetical protein
MITVAEQVAHLTSLIEDTRERFLCLELALRGDDRHQAVYAARVLHEMRPALASAGLTAETLGAALSASRRDTLTRGIRLGWEARDAGEAHPAGTAPAPAPERRLTVVRPAV